MDGRLAVVLADLAEEFLHLAGRLIHIDDPARLVAYAAPQMGNLARDENALPGARAEFLLGNMKLELAVDHINPLVLIVVEVLRSARVALELEYTHSSAGVLARNLAVNRLALGSTELNMLTKSVVARANAEPDKHFL